jgi:hypothetical protein
MHLRTLYASIKYEQLHKQDKKMLTSLGILNGYGGGGQSPIARFLIGIICRKFKEANAEKHDYGFWLGGNLARFHECNTKFYLAMQRDATRLIGWKKYHFLFIAFLAYLAVDLF